MEIRRAFFLLTAGVLIAGLLVLAAPDGATPGADRDDSGAVSESIRSHGTDAPGRSSVEKGGSRGSHHEAVVNYYDAEHLSELWMDLSHRQAAGDASASRWLAEIAAECMQAARSHGSVLDFAELAGRVRPESAALSSKAAETTLRRCDGIGPDRANQASYLGALQAAAAGGDLAAEITLYQIETIAARADVEAAVVGGLAREALQQGDPAALFALGEIVRSIPVGEIDGIPTGTMAAEAAWRVAACRLGLPCGPTSTPVRRMCFEGGINCSFLHVEDLYLREGLPPAEVPKYRQHLENLLKEKSS